MAEDEETTPQAPKGPGPATSTSTAAKLTTIGVLAAAIAVAVVIFAVAGGDDDDGGASADPGSGGSAEPTASTSTDLETKPEVSPPEGDPPSELVSADIVTGDGAEAKPGDQVSVQYVGVNYSDGEEFDTSWGREPFAFQLGAGMVIPGWDEGVPGMKVGGRRELTIPSDLAYGPMGQPPAIGPDETLVFIIDLLSVN